MASFQRKDTFMDEVGVGAAMAHGLADELRRRIREHGPSPFWAWMDECLYHRTLGYYNRPGRKTGTGRDADFVTPPTLHPFFATAIARELAAVWEAKGRPAAFRVVEYGGGEGGLARDALAAIDRETPALGAAITWAHVERGKAHVAAMQAAPRDPRILVPDMEFCCGPLEEAHDAHDDVLLAVELVDALPFDVLECVGDGLWRRLHVGLEGDRFVECFPTAPEPWPVAGVPGQRVLDHAQATHWLDDAVEQRPTHLLLVDYGDVGARLWTRDRMDGTVRGFRDHAFADVLDAPGEVDITGSVDFTQFEEGAAMAGFRPAGFESLEAFLLRHGILEELNRIERTTLEGASSYLRLRQLLLPTGMGAAFKVARYETL